MSTPNSYWHASRIGPLSIRRRADGRWHVMWDSEDLGSYQTAQHALDDLAGGHCDWPGTTDPSTLGLPDEIGDWSAGT